MGTAHIGLVDAANHVSAPAVPESPLELLFLLYAVAAVGTCGAVGSVSHRSGLCGGVLRAEPPGRFPECSLYVVAAVCNLS